MSRLEGLPVDDCCAVTYPPYTGMEPCSQIGEHMYFFEDCVPAGMAVVMAACQACPLLEPCRDWAMAHEEYGMWAGMHAEHRRRERRKQGLVLHSPPASMTRKGYPDAVA